MFLEFLDRNKLLLFNNVKVKVDYFHSSLKCKECIY